MTQRDNGGYVGPDLIYRGKHLKEIWLWLIAGGGRCAAKHMGECRLELTRLSKLRRGGPHQAVSRSQAEAAVFRVAITVWLGGRSTLSVISLRNVIFVFTAQRGLSRAYTLNPML